MSTSLEDYVRQILPNDSCNFPSGDIFSPQLRPGVKNRILIYRGAFNPPHKGHLALLNYAFANCCNDMNILMAVILNLNDDTLSRKIAKEVQRSCEGEGEEGEDETDLPRKRPNRYLHFHLTKRERVRIWEGNGTLPPYYWVYPKSDTRWVRFEAALSDLVKSAGFELEFVRLMGSDHIGHIHNRLEDYNGLYHIISSDISREIEPEDAGMLQQMKGFGPWEEIVREEADSGTSSETPAFQSQLERFQLGFGDIQGVMKKDQGSASNTPGAITSAPKMLVCHQLVDPNLTCRFIHKPEEVRLLQVSSTKLRSLIAKNIKRTMLVEKLPRGVDRLALHADILWEILKGKWYDGW